MRYNLLALFVFLCGLLTLAIAGYSWRHRKTNGARPFAIFMTSLAIYVLGYSLELASLDVPSMLFWSKVQYLGTLSFPTLYLIFALQFTGNQKWLSRRNLLLLFLFPALVMGVKLFDDQFHLLYASTSLDSSGVIPLLAIQRGPLYPFVAAYNLLMVTSGNVLLFIKRRHGSTLYRNQTSLILIVALVIYLVYGIYLSGIPLVPGLKELDLNPFIYMLWGCAIALVIFRYRLFDLAPVARDALIELLSDGVIVLDTQARLMDANPEAQKLFGWPAVPVGEAAGALIQGWLAQAALAPGKTSAKLEAGLPNDSQGRFFEVTVSTLLARPSHLAGYLILVHDISERKETELKLQELSLVDDLTGLTNRRGFKLLADQLLGMANRMHLNAVMFYLDMDGLKWINDNLGHAVGDEALLEISHILKSVFRSADILARVGGDEFVILAIESFNNSAAFMRLRLDERIASHNDQALRKYRLSVSAGQAIYRWQNPCALEVLVQQADQAMYIEKQTKK